MILKSLTKIAFLTLLLPNCAKDNATEELPYSFVTNVENPYSNLLHLHEAKGIISKLTHQKYDDSFLDIDLDGKLDPYFIVNDSTAYTMLSKDEKAIPENQKAWLRVEPSLIDKVKKLEKMKEELKKLNNLNQFI